MIHHYFPGRRLKYSYSYSLGQSNSLNATEPAMDKMLRIMSLAVLLNEIPLQVVRGINTHSNLSFQVFLPRHLICGVSLCQLHLPQLCVGHGGSWGWVGAPVRCSASATLLHLEATSQTHGQHLCMAQRVVMGQVGFVVRLIRSQKRDMRCSPLAPSSMKG